MTRNASNDALSDRAESPGTAGATRYANQSRRPKPAVLVLILVAHIAILYGLARAFAPDTMASVERSVISVFDVTTDPPRQEPPPPPPEPLPEPDEGAQGAPGKKATPKSVVAPEPAIKLAEEKPIPKVSSTGTQDSSGAAVVGTGTGAAGTGTGTGSGRGGIGGGGIVPATIATKPQHISGSINAARDFPIPEGGRSARRGNRVIVKVTVGTNGRASNCSIYRASPDGEADRITCQLVVQRLGFKPAIDSNGNPVAAPFYWEQRWF